MTHIKNNQEFILLGLVVLGMAIMAVAIGSSFRGGNEWAFAHHSVRQVLGVQ